MTLAKSSFIIAEKQRKRMLLDKENLPLVAMEFMNDVHKEDADIINELFELVLDYEKEEKLDQKYKEWYDHTVEHFRGEEVMMQEKNFPPYPFHKAEHDNALAQMRDVFDKWHESRDIALLKSYFIEILPQWLLNHIESMDTVTAMFFKTGLSPCSMR